MAVPKYMDPLTEGSMVVAVLSNLETWAKLTNNPVPKGFKADAVLGPLGTKLVKQYQRTNGLSVDGGVGPEMRGDMLARLGFDFERTAYYIGGTTTFVQPNGGKIKWSREIEDAARLQADRVRGVGGGSRMGRSGN